MSTMLFSKSMLEEYQRRINEVNTPVVSFPKSVARALVTELLRFYEQQTMLEAEKVMLVQSLTFEYACMHIGDLVTSVLESDDFIDGSTQATLGYLLSEIKNAAEESKIKPLGTA